MPPGSPTAWCWRSPMRRSQRGSWRRARACSPGSAARPRARPRMRRSPRRCARRVLCPPSATRASARRIIRLPTVTDGHDTACRTSMRPDSQPPELRDGRAPAGAGSTPRLSLVTGGTPPRRRGFRPGAAVLAAAVMLVVIGVALPSIRLRAEAAWLVVTGRIPDLTLGDLLSMMRPGSGELQLGRLLDTHNPYAVIQAPPLDAAQKAAGRKLYGQQCAGCHAPDGTGGPGAPALVGRPLAHGEMPWAIYRTIHYGVRGT